MRKIRPTRRSVSGYFMFRGQESIAYESTLERDFLIRTAFFLHVLDVIPQPAQIPFVGHDGRSYRYTPDFLVYYRLGSESWMAYPKPILVEVKPEQAWRQHWRAWLPKWKAAWRYAQENGWEFHIRDESRIRDGVFKNIQFLQRYKPMTFPTEESRWVISSLQEMGSAPFHYLLARHFAGSARGEGISHLWHLLATRQLECDISRPLDQHTELWIPADDFADEQR